MSKKNAQIKDTTEQKEASNNEPKKEIVYVQQNNYVLNIVLFCVAILIGMLLQYNQNLLTTRTSLTLSDKVENHEHKPVRTTDHPAPFDMDAVYKQMSDKLKKEIMESISKENQLPIVTTTTTTTPSEDRIVNDSPKVIIDAEPIKDEKSEIKFTKTNEPIVINPESIQIEKKNEEKKKKRDAEVINRKKQKEEKRKQEESASKKTASQQDEVPAEIKNFNTIKISKMQPKKMWIPIPNSNGGHRRVPAVEVKAGKEHKSSVKIWLYEEFLSQEECDNLIKVHESHLAELLKQKPIICFDSISTLRKNLIELNKKQIADEVTPVDFTEGTMCLNQTFSRQLEKWGLKWSYSTAFYPGESKFATLFGKRIEEATQLNETHGGKFQITSYPNQVGYKEHTDCMLNTEEQRDRYATFLVYLNDMGADGGGQTVFPNLGIDVKPRQGRALTWNSMNYETGKCEKMSIHSATKVEHITKKKYVIQRWYYLKNFYALGKRTTETSLPERSPNTPKVSCDDYDHGSCRLYG